jgi:hypothetical protein
VADRKHRSPAAISMTALWSTGGKNTRTLRLDARFVSGPESRDKKVEHADEQPVEELSTVAELIQQRVIRKVRPVSQREYPISRRRVGRRLFIRMRSRQ